MGKTEKGAIWLDHDLLSPLDYWQFWRNTDDKDVINYLRYFTEVSEDEIKKISNLDGKDINEGKIILANEVTKMLHGMSESRKAYETSKKTFEEKSFDENLPTFEIKKNNLKKGIALKEILIKINFATSNSDYKRNIQNSAYKINNQLITDEFQKLSFENLQGDKIKISFGKKKHYLIKIT